jgi:histidinol dehydrogenase
MTPTDTETVRLLRTQQQGIEAAKSLLTRNNLQDNPQVETVVREIIEKVRKEGDGALLELGRRFDCDTLNALEVTRDEIDAAAQAVSPQLMADLKAAAENIREFHDRQARQTWMHGDGARTVGQMILPLRRVGFYVPGGTAVYPSSLLMCVLPARSAGVEEVVVCSPCGRDGTLHPLVLAAAHVAGVDRLFKIGGAQAVAAMALGTRTVPAVDKIVGPGNSYVNVAKKLLWGVVDIDMLAGPSEVCVVADSSANPEFAAADMLTQAEHDVEAAAFLICHDEQTALSTVRALEQQMQRLPRKDILRRALAENGAVVVTRSLDESIELANHCAPEHLALMVQDPFAVLPSIRNAGAVLLGSFSPQTLGDYLAGPSHTLPTSGTARFSSPLNVDTFVKKTSFIHYSPQALAAVSDTLVRLAEAEGFGAHAAAVEIRRNGHTG